MNFQMSHYIQMPPYPAAPPYDMFKIDQANWLRGSFGGVGIPGDYDKYMPDWAKAVVARPPRKSTSGWWTSIGTTCSRTKASGRRCGGRSSATSRSRDDIA